MRTKKTAARKPGETDSHIKHQRQESLALQREPIRDNILEDVVAKVSLNGKTRAELERLLKDIDAEFVRREKQNRKDALKAAKAAAAEYGFSLEDLLAEPKTKRKGRRRGPRGPQPAKYQDTASAKTWSGMGRPPAWFKAHVDAGQPDTDLLIA